MVMAVEEQVNAHSVERILAVVDVVIPNVQRIMVGGIRACVRHNDAPFLVGSIQHALAPLELFLHDLGLLIRRSDFAVQDNEDSIAIFEVAHRAVKLRIAVFAPDILKRCANDTKFQSPFISWLPATVTVGYLA